MKFRDRILILIFVVTDLLLLNISLLITAFVHYNAIWVIPNGVVLLNICWITTFLHFINAKLFIRHTFISRSKGLIIKMLIYLSIASFLIVFLNLDNISRALFLGSFLIFLIFKFLISYFYSYLISNKQAGEHFGKVLIVGAGNIGLSIGEFYLKNPERGQVIGYLDDVKLKSTKYNILGTLKDFSTVVNSFEINDVIIALNSLDNKIIKEIIKIAEYHGIRPRIVPDYYGLFNRNYEIMK